MTIRTDLPDMTDNVFATPSSFSSAIKKHNIYLEGAFKKTFPKPYKINNDVGLICNFATFEKIN